MRNAGQPDAAAGRSVDVSRVALTLRTGAPVPESSPGERTAATTTADAEPVPAGQRFFDNIFALLVLGLVVMFVLYTGWGLWEILTLPEAPLP
jgi:hypothetical protein